jgi:hypothetical protein
MWNHPWLRADEGLGDPCDSIRDRLQALRKHARTIEGQIAEYEQHARDGREALERYRAAADEIEDWLADKGEPIEKPTDLPGDPAQF